MIRLKDNTPVPRDPDTRALCRDIQDQVCSGSCVLVDLLEMPGQDPVRAAEGPKLFQYWDNGTYAAGNFVGQLEYHGRDGGVEELVISARGPGFPGDARKRDRQGSFFLQAMLEDCWEIPLHVLQSDGELRMEDSYNALLAARLAAQLDRAWRTGLLRFYRAVSRRDSAVKGRLDIPRELREGMGLQDGRIAYEVRAFTWDNDYNRLFLQACLEAERQYPSLMLHLRRQFPGCHAALQTLRSAPWGRLDTGALLDRTRKQITNPIYQDYETLRRIARALLLRQGGCARTAGSRPFVTGILLDLSQLWERFLLKRVLTELDDRQYQAEEWIMGGEMRIYPDLLWKTRHVVLDAKYKFKWADTLDGSWTGSIHQDVYQVLTYMLELGCDRGGVVFPTGRGRAAIEGLGKKALEIPVGQGTPFGGFSFWRFPFVVPDEISDYGAFRQAVDREAERLSGQIRDLVF